MANFCLCDPNAPRAFCQPNPGNVWVGNTPAHWPFNGSCSLPQDCQHHHPACAYFRKCCRVAAEEAGIPWQRMRNHVDDPLSTRAHLAQAYPL